MLGFSADLGETEKGHFVLRTSRLRSWDQKIG